MFKDREQAYKRGLIERARRHLSTGEEVRAIALAQGFVDPRFIFAPIVIAVVLVTGA